MVQAWRVLQKWPRVCSGTRSAIQLCQAAAAKLLAAELTRSPLFAEAVVLGDDSAQVTLGKKIFDHRFE